MHYPRSPAAEPHPYPLSSVPRSKFSELGLSRDKMREDAAEWLSPERLEGILVALEQRQIQSTLDAIHVIEDLLAGALLLQGHREMLDRLDAVIYGHRPQHNAEGAVGPPIWPCP